MWGPRDRRKPRRTLRSSLPGEQELTQNLHWFGLSPGNRGGASSPFRGGPDAPAGAQGDRGGSPRVENPGHSEISRRSSAGQADFVSRSEEHTSELQSLAYLVCRLL